MPIDSTAERDSERADSERADSERADSERADSERADSERADDHDDRMPPSPLDPPFALLVRSIRRNGALDISKRSRLPSKQGDREMACSTGAIYLVDLVKARSVDWSVPWLFGDGYAST
jgi:hypothetical protein